MVKIKFKPKPKLKPKPKPKLPKILRRPKKPPKIPKKPKLTKKHTLEEILSSLPAQLLKLKEIRKELRRFENPKKMYQQKMSRRK